MTTEEFIEKLYYLQLEYIFAWQRLQLALDKASEIQLALPEHKEL